jgi:hypothetical protein
LPIVTKKNKIKRIKEVTEQLIFDLEKQEFMEDKYQIKFYILKKCSLFDIED